MRKRMLIFRPLWDEPGKRDVTHAFLPESIRFHNAVCSNDSTAIGIDNRLPFAKRQAAVSKALADADDDSRPYDGVAFFCHGWKNGIQLGVKTKDVFELADRIHRLCEHSFPVVPLFCCSTGGDVLTKKSSPGTGDDSFADRLRDALCDRIGADGYAPYPRVMAHETVAHTTKNPRVRFFDGMGSKTGGVGGYRPVNTRDPHWRAWVKKLRDHEDPFRFEMPFLTIAEIEAALGV